MKLTLSNLKPAPGAIKKPKDIGRGGKRGSYSGRGIKGQKARSGGRKGLKALGMRKRLMQIPKVRGFHSHHPKMKAVNISSLNRFDAGAVVDVRTLIKAGLAHRGDSVKILGNGKLERKLTVHAHAFSEAASKSIVEAGGAVVVIGTGADQSKKA